MNEKNVANYEDLLSARDREIERLNTKLNSRKKSGSFLWRFLVRIWLGKNTNQAIEAYKDHMLEVYSSTKAGSFSSAINQLAEEQPVASANLLAAIAARVLRRSRLMYISSFLTICAALAGFWLAFNANSLLKQQNVKVAEQVGLTKKQNQLIETQNALSEANRRSALIYDLTSIMDSIQVEAASFTNGYTETLPMEIQSRIVAVSKAMRPYRYLKEDGTLTERALSPERGQLLLYLAQVGARIPQEASFESADLRGAHLFRANLYGAKLANADLRNAILVDSDFGQADLRGALLNSAYMSSVNFGVALLDYADFEEADLSGSTFNETDITDTNFKNANIANIKASERVKKKIQGLGGVEFSGTEYHERFGSPNPPVLILK